MRVRDIQRSFLAAQDPAQLWSVLGFLDSGVFFTTSGAVGLTYRVQATDYEGLNDAQRKAVADVFESGLALLSERHRLYQHLIKTESGPLVTPMADDPMVQRALTTRTDDLNRRSRGRFTIDLFITILYEPPAAELIATKLTGLIQNPFAALRHWWQPDFTIELLEADLLAAATTLEQTTANYLGHLAGALTLNRLSPDETLQFLCRLVDYSAPPVPLRADRPVNEQMKRSSRIHFHDTHLRVGPTYVEVLTMREPPNKTFAHLLEKVYTVQGALIACLEWQKIPTADLQARIMKHTIFWNNKRFKLSSFTSKGKDTDTSTLLKDESAVAMVEQLNQMNHALEVDGRVGGYGSLTLVVPGPSLEQVQQTVADVWATLSRYEGSFLRETDNRLNAWAAIVPDGSAYNIRYQELLDTTLTDLSFLFTLDQGDPDHAVAVFETRHTVPYHFALSEGGDDTRHLLLLGSTGSGKSFWLNFLLTHLARFRAQMIVFEEGRSSSYRHLCEALGGSMVTFDLDGHIRINPFALPPTPAHLHFLHTFCRLLINGDDFTMSREHEDRLFDVIEAVYRLDRHRRRLMSVAELTTRVIPGRLDQWVGDGPYASLFDNVEDTLEVSGFQVFHAGALAGETYAAVLEPLQFYCLHRVESRLSPDRVTVCVMDELERLIRQPVLRAHLQRAMPGWRKANGIMVLATQHVEGLRDAQVLQPIIEACETTVFGHGNQRNLQTYAELFRLNEQEVFLLDHLIAKREFLVKRGAFAKVINLTVTPWEAQLYGHPVAPLTSARPMAAEGVA